MSAQELGKHEKNCKKTITVQKNFSYNANIKIGLWFLFPITKPWFGHTRLQSHSVLGQK